MEPRVEIKEHMRGGKGHVIMKHLLGEKELNGKCRIYAEITLEPGCEIVVPTKTQRERRSLAEIMSISSSATSMAARITSIVNMIKN